MAVGNPAAFWGLMTLLIPLLVLFLSRKKQKVVEFGSISFLIESTSKSLRKLFPTQWILFLLRILILGLLVALLLQPQFDDTSNGQRVLIEQEIYEDEDFASLLTGLETVPETFETNSHWLLIDELNKLGDSVTVYTRSYEKHFKGRELALGGNIEWKVVPNAKTMVLSDTSLIDGTTKIGEFQSDEEGLRWLERDSDLAFQADSISIQVISSRERKKEAGRLLAVIRSFASNLPIHVLETESAQWTFLVDTTSLAGLGAQVAWNDFDGGLELIRENGRRFVMKGDLKKEELVSTDFSIDLAYLLLSARFGIEDLDRRVKRDLPKKASVSSGSDLARKKEVRWYFYVPMLILLSIERILSRNSMNL